jgi:hypothetical protein
MPPVRIDLNPAVAESSAVLDELQIGAPIWIHWIRIAKAQTALARGGAETAPPPAATILAALQEPVRGTMTDEMYPAMIAIITVTIVLDGLYDQLKPFAPVVPRSVDHRPNRQNSIVERLKLCFSVGKQSHRWIGEFEWLYGLRHPAVHPKHKAHPVVAHPSGWGNVPALYADYSADNAEKALALLENVLRTCVDNPKPAARTWAEGTGKGALGELAK